MTIAEQGDELMKLRQEEFKQIIKDNQLNVKREECVWDVLLKWVDKDPENRKNDLLFLLPKVRFGLMDSKYFIKNVMTIIWLTFYMVIILVRYSYIPKYCLLFPLKNFKTKDLKY